MALAHIRAGSINSLNEASSQAQYCRLFYPMVRDQCLEDAPWQFARKLDALALLDEELFNWAYVYQYPSDCLRINRLLLDFEAVAADTSLIAARLYDLGLPKPNLNRQVEYKIYNIENNRVIAANDTNLRVDYRVKITDPNLFSFQFIWALSHLLASSIATPIVGVTDGKSLRSDNLSLYKSFIQSAVAANLNEQYTSTPDSEFITVRQ